MQACVNQSGRLGRIRLLADDAGQTLIEAALAVSLLLTLLLGVVEMTPVIRADIEVENAARAGAQYATQNTTTAADITGIEKSAAADAPDITLTWGTQSVSISYTCSDGSTPNGSPLACTSPAYLETTVNVQPSSTVNPWVTLPFLPTSYTVSGSAVMQCLEC